MLPHIGTLRDSANNIRSIDTSITSDLFDGYQRILDTVIARIDQLENLRAETLANNRLSPTESISAIHYSIGLPIAIIIGFSDITLNMVTSRTIPGLPKNYLRWVNDLLTAANNILDLFEALTGKHVQD
jgi:hypothetical protein